MKIAEYLNFGYLFQYTFLLLSMITSSCSDDKFLAEIFANECVKETWYIFPGDNPSPEHPYVLISMCHALLGKSNKHLRNQRILVF